MDSDVGLAGGGANPAYNPAEQDAGVAITQQVNVDGQIKGSGQINKNIAGLHQDVLETMEQNDQTREVRRQGDLNQLVTLDSRHPELAPSPTPSALDSASSGSYFGGNSVKLVTELNITIQKLAKSQQAARAEAAQTAIDEANRSREQAKLAAEASIDGAEKNLDMANAGLAVGITMGSLQFVGGAAQAQSLRSARSTEKEIMNNPELVKAGDVSKASTAEVAQLTKARDARLAAGGSANSETTPKITDDQISAAQKKADTDAAAYQKARDDARADVKKTFEERSTEAQVVNAYTSGANSISQGINTNLTAQGQLATTEGNAQQALYNNSGQDAQKTEESVTKGAEEIVNQAKDMIDAIGQAISKRQESVNNAFQRG